MLMAAQTLKQAGLRGASLLQVLTCRASGGHAGANCASLPSARRCGPACGHRQGLVHSAHTKNKQQLRSIACSGAGPPWMTRPSVPHQLKGHVVQVRRHVGEREVGVAVHGDLRRGRVLAHADGPRVEDCVLRNLQRRAPRADHACARPPARRSARPALSSGRMLSITRHSPARKTVQLGRRARLP